MAGGRKRAKTQHVAATSRKTRAQAKKEVQVEVEGPVEKPVKPPRRATAVLTDMPLDVLFEVSNAARLLGCLLNQDGVGR